MRIAEDGRYKLSNSTEGFGGASSIVYVSGVFGTASVKLVHLDEEQNEIDLEDGALLVNTQNSVDHGIGADVLVRVTGSDGATAILITVRGRV